jgi:hypothetical protein
METTTQPTIYLAAASDPTYRRKIHPDSVKWSSYLEPLVKTASEGSDVNEVVCHSNPASLDVICDFLDHWLENPPAENEKLLEWDADRLKDWSSVEEITLLQAANFLGIKPLEDKVILNFVKDVKDLDIPGLKGYLRTDREFTKEEEEEVRARINIAYY